MGFFAVHHDLPGRIDADTHLVAFDRKHRDAYVVIYLEAFADPSRELAFDRTPLQHQHPTQSAFADNTYLCVLPAIGMGGASPIDSRDAGDYSAGSCEP